VLATYLCQAPTAQPVIQTAQETQPFNVNQLRHPLLPHGVVAVGNY